MWQDLRFSVRILAKERAFTFTAILVLALGLALHATMLSLVNGLLAHPLPGDDPSRLRLVMLSDPAYPEFASDIRWSDYVELRDHNAVFQGLAARAGDTARLTARDDIRQVRGEIVSGNYFEVLGSAPLIGRAFTLPDDDPAAPPIVVISADLWKARFDADPAVVGRSLTLDARAYTIIGVMPEAFHGTLGPWELTQYWAPARQRAVDLACRRPDLLTDAGFGLIGRLPSDVSEGRAQQALSTFRLRPVSTPAGAPPNAAWTPKLYASVGASLPFDTFRQVVPARLGLGLMLMAGLVILIAAVNVAGMQAARGVMRDGELATRAVLGATRWRVIRQLVMEGILLALAGGALGLLMSRWLVAGFSAAVPTELGRFDLLGTAAAPSVVIDAPFTWTVFAYTVALCVAVGIAVGLVPIRQMRRGGLGALTGGASSVAPRATGWLRYGVVVPQLALSLVLLLVGGTLVRTVLASQLVEPGYATSELVSVSFASPPVCRIVRMSEGERRSAAAVRARFQQQAVNAVRNVPGVAIASLTTGLPPESPRANRAWLMAEHPSDVPARFQGISLATVDTDYFETLRVPLVRGRVFRSGDEGAQAQVIVVSQALATRFWRDGNPVGQRVSITDPAATVPPQWREVIGVVDDVTSPLADTSAVATAYVPLQPSGYARLIVARGTLPPAQLLREVKAAIAQVDPSFEIGNGSVVADTIDAALYPRRLAAIVLAVSGLIGLVLALVGMYGVVSYSVTQRTREIGVRIALGARRADIVRLIARDGLRTSTLAASVGLTLGYAAIRITSSRLVALPTGDRLTFVLAPILLALVVIGACYLPTRRATRVDPMAALRNL